MITKKRLLLILPYATLSALLIARLFLGVELTDEAYEIAAIYHCFLGKIPFVTSWDPHTGWCLLVPFMALYKLLVPTLDGVVLYFRLMCLLVSILFAAAIIFINNFKNRELIFPILFIVPFSIYQLNYFILPQLMVCLAFSLLFFNRRRLRYSRLL